MVKQIRKDYVYLVQKRGVGISGFVDWDKTETRLMRGDTVKARGHRSEVIGRGPNGFSGSRFRLENGRLPEYQEIRSGDAAAMWVLETGNTAVLL